MEIYELKHPNSKCYFNNLNQSPTHSEELTCIHAGICIQGEHLERHSMKGGIIE